MAITKYNKTRKHPFYSNFFDDDFVRSFFNESYTPKSKHSSAKVNVSENDKGYFIDFLVPGVAKKDINIDIDGDNLTVSYEHSNKLEEETPKFSRKEFAIDSFKRSFTLPKEVETENISASLENGILKVEIPKAEIKDTKKTISIK